MMACLRLQQAFGSKACLKRLPVISCEFPLRIQQRSLAVQLSLNYYDILEVSPKASQNQIKAAYFRLSKKYHPDVAAPTTAEAKDKFSALSAAYEVLRNPKSRNRYDVDVLGHFASGEHSDVGVEYREFIRRRGTFRNRVDRSAAATGQSPMFNFDEFYRQHYGEFIRQAQMDKQVEEEKRSRQHEAENATFHSRLAILYFVFLTATFVAFMK